jgi:hypothetical protein
MKRYQLLPVNNPIVEIECAGNIVQTDPMKNAKENPNFPDPVVTMDVVCPLSARIIIYIHYTFVCECTYL